MKLLFCGHCNDIVRLFPERRSCKCGQSWGQYLSDNSTTIQTNNSLSLGLANSDFHEAVRLFLQNRDHFSPALSVRAWLNPNSEPDVTYTMEDGEQIQAEKASEAEPNNDPAAA